MPHEPALLALALAALSSTLPVSQGTYGRVVAFRRTCGALRGRKVVSVIFCNYPSLGWHRRLLAVLRCTVRRPGCPARAPTFSGCWSRPVSVHTAAYVLSAGTQRSGGDLREADRPTGDASRSE